MSMIVHTDPQGSDAWLAARRGVITGSRFKVAREKLKTGLPSKASIGYARDLARERCGGSVLAPYVTPEMKIGTDEEPHARHRYEIVTGELVLQAGFITTADRILGVSVDGFVGDDGLIEIKTLVSSNTLFDVLVNKDYSEYLDQCNGEMLLLKKNWCDLVLWAPDLADATFNGMHVHRIHRDDATLRALDNDLSDFADRVAREENALRARLETLAANNASFAKTA